MDLAIKEATGADLSTWREFEATLEKVSSMTSGLKIGYTLLSQELALLEKKGLQFPAINTRKLYKQIAKLSDQVLKLNYAYMYTQNLTAGIQPSKQFPGDIDIVLNEAAAAELGPDQVERAKLTLNKIPEQENLGIHPLIIAGVAVVALVVGAVVTVSALNNRAEKYKAEIEKGRQQLEKAALANPGVLPDYTALRATEQHKQAAAWMDRLLGPGAGKALTGGILGIGFVLVGVFVLFKMMDRK